MKAVGDPSLSKQSLLYISTIKFIESIHPILSKWNHLKPMECVLGNAPIQRFVLYPVQASSSCWWSSSVRQSFIELHAYPSPVAMLSWKHKPQGLLPCWLVCASVLVYSGSHSHVGALIRITGISVMHTLKVYKY